MEERELGYFDSYLGGEEILPSSVNVKEFCRNRIDEILMLTEAIKESPFRGQAFQRLPKHMRRRQMSHYVKRLPRRLRNTCLSTTKEEMPQPSKRPSRKYRRRPSNLLLEYNRRQRKSVWLETHIWHSKRFHMTTKWGYKLPEKPSNKSFRACYRAAAQHCFLTDISYYNCVELRGSETKLLDGLQQCVSPKCGLTFAAKMYKNGSREGSVTLYHPQSFPHRVIGNVSFLWKPIDEEEEARTIWIFMHPALHSEIVSILSSLFSLERLNVLEAQPTVGPSDIQHTKEQKKLCEKITKKMETNSNNEKLKSKNIPFDRTPKYSNIDGSVTMTLLKDTINRFRLTGPLSLAVISEAFNVNTSSLIRLPSEDSREDATVRDVIPRNPTGLKRNYAETFPETKEKNCKKIKLDANTEASSAGKEVKVWWKNYYKNELNHKSLENQDDFYKLLGTYTSPLDLPSRMAFSVVVTDPRLTIPSRRTKSRVTVQDSRMISLSSVDVTLCRSPLWVADVRDEVSNIKLSTAEINQARSKLIVPGSSAENILGSSEQTRVPLIVIQRPGDCGTYTEKNDFGSGFDVIVPAGWAMPVWLSLIYRGARTGGLRESDALILESCWLNEYLQPDSCAGESENWERYKQLRTSYFKKPPNKRPNFLKLAVQSPFYFPWKVLLKDWKVHSSRDVTDAETENSEISFYVLRDKKKLTELNDLVQSVFKVLKSKTVCKFSHSFDENEIDCLVQVTVECFRKGTPKAFAMICLPTRDDLQNFESGSISPTEKSHPDYNKEIRKLTKFEHIRLLKSMRRKRKRLKTKETYESQKAHDATSRPSENDLDKDELRLSKENMEKYHKTMEELWLQEPHSIKSIMNSCSRTIMGFIVLGDYSYSKSHGNGLGYITLRSLLLLLKMCFESRVHPLVLFRNTNSINYIFGRIRICTL